MSSPTELDHHLDAYLAIRQAVGLTNKARHQLLRKFVAYAQSAEVAADSPIRAATAVAWAWDGVPTTCGVRWRSERLTAVRGFLAFLTCIVPGTEVPASRIVAASTRRRPYVFSDEEMTGLISAAARPNPHSPFRPVVLSMLLGLLASTGLRVGEAIRLRMSDLRLDDEHPNLQVLQTKFQKSRMVPIHPTVSAALDCYLTKRREHARHGWSDRLFVNRRGDPLVVHTIGAWFAQLARSHGITPASEQGRRPCLTSFRHTFAVRRLREWHKAGLDVQSLLPTLAVYLGHVGPESSYWYLSATPDLLRAAGARFTLDVAAGGEQ
jgi:integrase/recombinase XerD